MSQFTKKAGSVGSAPNSSTSGGGSGAGAKKYSKISSYVCVHDGARAIVTLKNQLSHWYREDLVPFTLKKDTKVDVKEIAIGGSTFAFYPEGVPIRTNRGEWVLPGGQHDKLADDSLTRDLVVARWRDETGCSLGSSNKSSESLSLFGMTAESVSTYNSPCGRFSALRLKFSPEQLDKIVVSMNQVLEHPDRIELSTRTHANDIDEADADDTDLLAYANKLLCDDLKKAEIAEFASISTYFSNATSQGWFTEIVENVNSTSEPPSPEKGEKVEKEKGERSPKYIPKTGAGDNTKTVPCKSFATSGFCKYGDSCRFLHSSEGGKAGGASSSEGSWKASPSTSPRTPPSPASAAAKGIKEEADGWATVVKPIRPQTRKEDKTSPKGPAVNVPRGPLDKKVTFFRQGESLHNASHDTTVVDPGLTEKGKAQVDEKIHGLYVAQAGRAYQRQAPEIIVVSPMRRCLETAKALKDIQPKIVAEELCRGECLKKNVDKRSTISEKKAEFPFIDFSNCTTDEDDLFGTEDDESDKTAQIEKVRARAGAFLASLEKLKEKDIVVISHCKFIKSLMCHVNNVDMESNVEGLKHGSHATFFWSPERGWEVSAVNVKVVPREAPKASKP